VRAAAYYRMSDPRQEDSVGRQRSQVEPHARKLGVTIVREYTDEGIPGDQIAKRKDFQRMLRDAQAGLFDCILCDDKDRFGRFDAIDLGEVVAPLRRKGVWLETVAQGKIDWNSFAGRITDAVLQEAKNLESEATSRRVLSGQLLKAQKGVTTGGRACYGYRWEADPERGKRLVPDGRKADVVRLAFRRYAEGATLWELADELYRRGVPSPLGAARWTRTVIQRMLSNRRYVGDWTWGVHPQGKRHRYTGSLRQSARGERRPRQNAPDAWIVLPGAHEPLIDRETFERVQARLRDNQKRTGKKRAAGNFALGGLLVCGHCGSRMVGATQRGRRMYVCGAYLLHATRGCHKNWIAEAAITDLLIRKLQEAYLDPARLQELREEMARVEAEQRADDNLDRLRRRVETLDRQISQGTERLLLLPADRVPGAAAKLREWEGERDEVKAELRRAETSSPVESLEACIQTAEKLLWNLQDCLKAEDTPLLRELFREMIDHVELHWTHRKAGALTRSAFHRGVIHPASSGERSYMFPSAGR
jgi:site-specific DNA recombinase